MNSNLNLLEDFSRERPNDPFRWIPQGLFYNLIDNRNDRNVSGNILLPNDLVNGYLNQQMFNALDADITNPQGYRVRLLQENGNNQAANIVDHFSFYRY